MYIIPPEISLLKEYLVNEFSSGKVSWEKEMSNECICVFSIVYKREPKSIGARLAVDLYEFQYGDKPITEILDEKISEVKDLFIVAGVTEF